MKIIDHIHGGYVHRRRVRVLSDYFASSLPRDLSMLDVGCGDGRLARILMEARPDLKVTGVDVLEREDCAIPMKVFDGKTLPFRDGEFDAVLFVDVLHHATDPYKLLEEGVRVAKRFVAMKDHTRNGLFAGLTLRFMDKIGNSRHGVALPFTYWSHEQWLTAFDRLGLSREAWSGKVPLYPWPASLVFTRKFHFCALLTKQGTL
jgi:SAM-dependent methyltransferase